MNATLNIYSDCSSDKPTKTYTCKRLLMKTSKSVGSLVEQLKDKDEKEQEEITIKVIQTIFPSFTKEDFDGLDPNEWTKFVEEVAKETAVIVKQAQKN